MPRRPRRRAQPRGAGPSVPPPRSWTFLSNHAHVLLCLRRRPAPSLREVARRVGITERTVSTIVLDLEREGLLERRREGRRNRYAFHLDRPLRHPLEAHRDVATLVALVE